MRPVERDLWGHTVADPYHWMRERDNPDVVAHLEAENAFTEAALDAALKAEDVCETLLVVQSREDGARLFEGGGRRDAATRSLFRIGAWRDSGGAGSAVPARSSSSRSA